MIVWIDGTYCVGKTTSAYILKEKLKHNNKALEIEVLDSDVIYQEFERKNWFYGGGAYPQNNLRFNQYFRQVIEEKLQDIKGICIIVMALTDNVCKDKLFDPLQNERDDMLHIILTASEITIKERIKNSNRQDKEFALMNLQPNLKFLDENYKEAIRIDTDNIDFEDVIKEIMEFIGERNG